MLSPLNSPPSGRGLYLSKHLRVRCNAPELNGAEKESEDSNRGCGDRSSSIAPHSIAEKKSPPLRALFMSCYQVIDGRGQGEAAPTLLLLNRRLSSPHIDMPRHHIAEWNSLIVTLTAALWVFTLRSEGGKLVIGFLRRCFAFFVFKESPQVSNQRNPRERLRVSSVVRRVSS